MKRSLAMILCLILLLGLCACAGVGGLDISPWTDAHAMDARMELSYNDPAEEQQPSVMLEYLPSADGKVVYQKSGAVIDASNLKDGYVMCKYTLGETKLKVRITGPNGVKLDFSLRSDGQWETFPLSYGSGSYKVGVYKHKSGNKYTTLLSQTVEVKLENELAPFLRPNQKAFFTAESAVVAKAAELCAGCTTELEKVAAIYNYVINNITYDYDKAQMIVDGSISGYVPDVDQVLESGTGVCSDYSSLMAAMLRSQGVATKVVYGYAGDVYHAWISVYTVEYGWVEAAVYFDGEQWMRMDPTFVATGGNNTATLDYIGDGTNYSVKYMY